MIILSEPTDSWPTTERDTLVAPPPPPPPLHPQGGPPPDRRIGAGMLLAIGAIILVGLGALIAWLLTHRGGTDTSQATTVLVTTAPASTTAAKVVVPRLVGLKEEQALIRLGRAGLNATEVRTRSTKPAGLVLGQAPRAASELTQGSRVRIVVSRGAPGTPATVPAVTTSPAGTTAATTPAATTTPATTGTTTAATTTAAAPTPRNATMPDVQGQTEPAAVQALGDAGILPSLVFVPGQDTLGTVVEQAKPAGATLPFHTHVQINLSRGPHENPLQPVPNVIGKTLADAVAAMQGAQLRLIYLKLPVASRPQAGKIVQQSPLGGGHAPEKAQVLVYLGAYTAR